MSFYFEIESEKLIDLTDVLNGLKLDDVPFHSGQDEDDYDENAEVYSTVFFQKEKSVCGVNLASDEKSYFVGLNAFTSRSDATLALEIAVCLGKILEAPIRPEDREEFLDEAQLRKHCSQAWEDRRANEAYALVDSIIEASSSMDATTTIYCYRRPIQLSKKLISELEEQGLTRDQLIEELFKQARTLQEIHFDEGFFPASVFGSDQMRKPRPVSKTRKLLNGLLGRGTQEVLVDVEESPYSFFLISPKMPTLTPEADFVVFMRGNDLRKMPFHDFQQFAEMSSFRRFGASCYVVPALSWGKYRELYNQGVPT